MRRRWLRGVAVLAACPILVLLARWDPRAFATLLAVPVVLAGLEYPRRRPPAVRAAFLAFLVIVACSFSIEIASEVRENLREPPEWDFLGFWLHARTAVTGGDFYDPHQAKASAAAISTSREFRREIVDTGFWYPPPSMFLFLPLGWFNPQAALALWYGFHFAVLAFDVLLLRRIFFPEGGLPELAACGTLVCTAHATLSTVHFCQTSFVALLCLLLLWQRRASAAGGVWLAAAVLVKPFFAALALNLLARARWRALAGCVAAGSVLSLTALFVFGPRTFASYLVGDAAPKPDWIYHQWTNQSVFGWVLRATQATCEGLSCLTHPLHVAIVGVLALVTLPLVIGLARVHEEWALGLCLCFALLVYPVSQPFYAVLLLPVLLLMWRERHRIPGGASAVALLAGVVSALAAVAMGRATVDAVALLWVAMAAVGIGLLRGRGWPLANP